MIDINAMIAWAAGLFAPAEVEAALWIVLGVVVGVQVVKLFFRYSLRSLSLRELLGVSILVSLVAAWGVWPADSSTHHLFPGLIAGPLCNMMFWGAAAPVKRWAPWLWQILNGEVRRRRKLPPPGGFERRAQP